MESSRVVAIIALLALPPGVQLYSFSEKGCKQAQDEINIRKCCNMPRLLPQDVVQRCRRRPLPSVPPGVQKPVRAYCQAECVLNVTRILMNGEFRVKQAIKVMVARVPNNTVAWNHNIEQAINKCYDLQVKNVFYLQYVAQNLISTQCIPSSIRFIECTFSIVYRDCPYQYWNFNDELCTPFVSFLNNCDYLFHSLWDI